MRIFKRDLLWLPHSMLQYVTFRRRQAEAQDYLLRYLLREFRHCTRGDLNSMGCPLVEDVQFFMRKIQTNLRVRCKSNDSYGVPPAGASSCIFDEVGGQPKRFFFVSIGNVNQVRHCSQIFALEVAGFSLLKLG